LLELIPALETVELETDPSPVVSCGNNPMQTRKSLRRALLEGSSPMSPRLHGPEDLLALRWPDPTSTDFVDKPSRAAVL